MKTLTVCFLSLLLASATFGKTFEGLVHFQITEGKRAHEMEYAIKGDRMRMKMQVDEKHSTGGIVDTKTGEIIVLMPEQKMYMVFGGGGEMARNAMQTDATIEETGRTETIAGYKCSEYIIKEKNSTIELWATEGLGRFVSFADVQKNRGKNPGWADVLADKELFPLRTINKDRRGRVQTKMEATRVEPRTLDASLFEVPAGYQKFEIPNLGGLLKGIRP